MTDTFIEAWREFKSIGIDEYGYLMVSFKHFKAGEDVFEVLQWFEDTYIITFTHDVWDGMLEKELVS